MRKIYLLLCVIVLTSCGIEEAKDCLHSSKLTEVYEEYITEIDTLIVRRDIEVSIKQSTENKIKVITNDRTYKKLKRDMSGKTLELSLDDVCPFGSSKPLVKVVLSVTSIKQIRNSSQYTISSVGQLNFPFMRLISESFNDNDALNSGDFKMDLNVPDLGIVSSGISDFYIKGKTEQLQLGFYNGSGAFYGKDLKAQKADIFYRSSRDSQLNVQQKATGEVRSTGSIFFQQKPDILAIECFYTGCWFTLD